ncbi:hypothetical protein [Pelobacter propionicus]|uniref:Uncharacterized protein n=1 Tax=Pelobacter propionicus (strain DSM 2379 / NBRC 103807 / OttBd1) TaxID=338966 RepID=A1AQW6_PELPD|nr:hypothetical protein [Pelobacter propionicus]ABK99736.1 hypothetical protein Ppro_2128 [Pelobacter propionicus DSM 2379]
MKVRAICEITTTRGTIPAGQVIEVSPTLLRRLAGKVALLPVDQTRRQATADTIITLWRWFTLEADRVYRLSPKAVDSWEQHKQHKEAAMELCRAGDMSAARLELGKALAALQGATITQPDLLGSMNMTREPMIDFR